MFNFCQNSRWQPKSYSQDKYVFEFYTEIQDGCQKWQQSDFCEMSPVHSADTLRVKNFITTTLSQISKIKSPVDSAENLQVRNFVEITLFRTVSKINVFCVLHRIQDGHPKMAGKRFLQNAASTLCRYPAGPKFCKIIYQGVRLTQKYL